MPLLKSANTTTNLSSIPVHARCFLMLRQTNSMSTEQWLPLKFAVHFQGLTFSCCACFPYLHWHQDGENRSNEHKYELLDYMHWRPSLVEIACCADSCDGTGHPNPATLTILLPSPHSHEGLGDFRVNTTMT